jgi:hypothetical protein
MSNLTDAPVREIDSDRGYSSGVSWGAVIGGAFVAASFYLMLLALGAGLELSSLSPWSNGGPSPSSLTAVAVAWLVLSGIISSALGGYLTGRLRIRWALIHTDEVFFRDTANGFLAWAVALVISVTLMASAATSMAGRVTQLRADPETTGVAANVVNPQGYFVDALFRSGEVGSDSKDAAKAEGARIFSNALRQGQMQLADQNYLAKLIASRTGITQPEAEKRISDVVADARQAEETARKASARLLIWFFFALIMGAFSASYAAMIGGRQRDHVKAM